MSTFKWKKQRQMGFVIYRRLRGEISYTCKTQLWYNVIKNKPKNETPLDLKTIRNPIFPLDVVISTSSQSVVYIKCKPNIKLYCTQECSLIKCYGNCLKAAWNKSCAESKVILLNCFDSYSRVWWFSWVVLHCWTCICFHFPHMCCCCRLLHLQTSTFWWVR